MWQKIAATLLSFALIMSGAYGRWEWSATDACEERALTDGATNHAPQVFDRYVVWVGYEWTDSRRSDFAIYVYDTTMASSRRIEGAVNLETVPQVEGNYLVWVGDEGDGIENQEVFLYDLSRDTLIQLTHSDQRETNPQISGQYIVWAASNPDSTSQVILYDIANAKMEILGTEDGNPLPDIKNNRIVWVASERGYSDIVLYDLPSRRTMRLTDSQAEVLSSNDISFIRHYAVQISDNLVVWQEETHLRDSRGHDTDDLYYYDGNEVRQIASTVVPGTSALVHAPYIAWAAYDEGEPAIFLYDTAHSITTRIAEGSLWISQLENA